MKLTRLVGLSLVAGWLASSPALAADPMPGMFMPDRLQWGPGPPGLPPGMQQTVLYGDPEKAGLLVIQAKLPPQYRVPPHWHPTDEVVTVISGRLRVGMGEAVNESGMTEFPAGGVVVAPAKSPHYVVAPEETVIQVAAMGPFDITYLNPADDPRKKP